MPAVGHISSERHYMGATSNGRYSTRGTRHPDYTHVRTADEARRLRACAPAWKARLYRDARVVGMVIDCADAKREVCALAEQLDELRERRRRACGDEAVRLTAAIARVTRAYDDALAYRRESSRQLRLVDVSPRDEAAILREARARLAQAQA